VGTNLAAPQRNEVFEKSRPGGATDNSPARSAPGKVEKKEPRPVGTPDLRAHFFKPALATPPHQRPYAHHANNRFTKGTMPNRTSGQNIQNHKIRGEWAELRFMQRATERGFRVTKP
jgi:hypothetical protein